MMEDIVVRNRGVEAARSAGDTLILGDLERSLRRPRTLMNFLLSSIATAFTLIALVPLFSVVYMLAAEGIKRLSWETFTTLPPAAFEEGGGFGNAIVGTLVMVGMGALITVPIGIMAAVYLSEIGPDTRLAQSVRFAAKVLSGFPSILAGVFVFSTIVMRMPTYSAYAGAAALAILMLPTVILTAEEAIRMVPAKIREAAVGMGATPAQVVWKVTLPTAMPGILTGVMLAIARAAGETAPLLFTALFSNFWVWDNGLSNKTASLAVLIYNFSGMPYENQKQLAWAAALVLVLVVLTTNLIGQSLSRRDPQE
jgi:phosphate transport system permease protein